MSSKTILCAGCGKKQPDNGRSQTCIKCGCAPLPSYSYPKNSGIHPVNCNCEDKPRKPLVRKRRTPKPTVKL